MAISIPCEFRVHEELFQGCGYGVQRLQLSTRASAVINIGDVFFANKLTGSSIISIQMRCDVVAIVAVAAAAAVAASTERLKQKRNFTG